MPDKQPTPKRRLRLIHTKTSSSSRLSNTLTLILFTFTVIGIAIGVYYYRSLIWWLLLPVLILTILVALLIFVGSGTSILPKKWRWNLKGGIQVVETIVFIPSVVFLSFFCALALIVSGLASVPAFIAEWVSVRYNDAVRRLYKKRAEMTLISVDSIQQWETLPFGRRFVFEGVIHETSNQYDGSTLVYQAQHEIYTTQNEEADDLQWQASTSSQAQKGMQRPIYVLFDGYPIMVHQPSGKHPAIEISTQEMTKIDKHDGQLYKGMRRVVGFGVGASVRVHGKIQLNERRAKHQQPYMIEKISLLSPLVQITRPPTVREAEKEALPTKSRFGRNTVPESVDVDSLTDFSVFNYMPSKESRSRFGGTRSGQSQTNKRRANTIIEALSGKQTPSRKSRFGKSSSTSRFGNGQSRFGGSSSTSRFGNGQSRFSKPRQDSQPSTDIAYDDLTSSTPENPLPFEDTSDS